MISIPLEVPILSAPASIIFIASAYVFTTTGSTQTFGIYVVLVLQFLYYAACTQGTQIPVVANVGLIDRYIVGITLYKNFVVAIICDYLGNLGQRLAGSRADFIAAALIKHIVVKADVYHALQNLYVNILKFFFA